MADFRKLSFIILGVGLLLITLLLVLMYFKYPSMDFEIYCSAVEVLDDGNDPYVLSNLQDKMDWNMPYRYAPITLPFFKVMCLTSHYVPWFIFLILAFFIIKSSDKGFKPFLYLVITFTGFVAVFKSFSIGNTGVIDLFFFSMILYFILKKNYEMSAIIIGFLSIFKIFPIVFIGLFFFVNKSLWERIKIMLLGISTFILLHLLSLSIYPKISQTYYYLLFKGYPLVDQIGYNNPSLFSIITKFFSSLNLVLYGLGIVLISTLLFYVVYKNKLNFISSFCLGVIAILLVLPELKPYSFSIALIPLYLLIKEKGNYFWYIIVACALPLLIKVMYSLFKAEINLIPILKYFCWYNQYIFLFIIFIMLCWGVYVENKN